MSHTYYTPFTQLTGHVNDLSNIYEHVAFAIRRLQNEKDELQSRVDHLEQDNPSAEVRRLRDENSLLRARLATAAREKVEVTRERDALFRKLYSISQLIDGLAVRQPKPSYDTRFT
jgi:predicted nuclease with TOPRIM domain